MIQLSNIRFDSIIPQKQIKNIQFSLASEYYQAETSIFKCKSSSILINDMTLQWPDIIKIPLNFDEPIKFKVSSPQPIIIKGQQEQSFMYGQFRVMNNRGKITSDVFSKLKGKKLKIGSLYINISIKENQMPFIQKIKPDSSSPRIQVSILIKNLANVPQKGCIVIDNGKRKLKSPLVSPSNSQKKQFYYLLRFRENFLKDAKNLLIISFYNEESVFIGKTIFKLTDKQKNLKERLINQLLVRVGDIYLNILSPIEEKQKNEQNTIKKRSGSLQVIPTIFSSRVSKQHNLPQKMETKSNFIDAISKKMSNVGFFKERKQKRQKGAHIGYGNRYDFTDQWKGNPGVGKYKLPSIF